MEIIEKKNLPNKKNLYKKKKLHYPILFVATTFFSFVMTGNVYVARNV